MRGLVQRVLRASVSVEGDIGGEIGGEGEAEIAREIVGEIGQGLCVFVGVTHSDGSIDVHRMAEKIWNLRVMDDDAGFMNLSIAETTKTVLIVSQFTLYGDTKRGRRPSWAKAAKPELAEPVIDALVEELRRLGATVQTGRFRSEMLVDLVNDGPVTVILDT